MKFEAVTDVRQNSRARPRSTIAGRAVKGFATLAQIIGGLCLSEVGGRNQCGFVSPASRLKRRRGTRHRRQFKFESKPTSLNRKFGYL